MKSKQRPNIVFLPRWYPNKTDPMPGLFIQRHAEVVQRFANIGVLYVHPMEEGMQENYEIESSVESGVETIRVYYSNPSNPLVKLYRYLSGHYKAYSYLKARMGKPDLIHVHILTRLGILAMLYKWFTGTPYVITEHWSRYLPITGTYRGWLRQQLTKLVVKQAKGVTAVTQNLMDAMKGWELRNSHYSILHNVVDTEVFAPGNGGTGHKIKRMIHVSCFEDKSKNISGLLNALEKLSRSRTDFECLMIGEGMDLEAMKSKAKSLGLKDKFVHFTGLMEKEEIAEEMQDSDFLVMFSNYENMPVVINEAFAAGLPVLATRVGGIPEHVNKEKGILIEPGNEEELLKALDFMLDHTGCFNREKIRQYAVDRFSTQALEEKLIKLYKPFLKDSTL